MGGISYRRFFISPQGPTVSKSIMLYYYYYYSSNLTSFEKNECSAKMSTQTTLSSAIPTLFLFYLFKQRMGN